MQHAKTTETVREKERELHFSEIKYSFFGVSIINRNRNKT